MTELESIEQFESLALAELAAEEEFQRQGDEEHMCELDEVEWLEECYRGDTDYL